MKTIYILFAICFLSFSLPAQNVGIGTATPHANALLHVDLGTSPTKGILFSGTYNQFSSTLPDLGAGTRMMFYPGKSAFRAGTVSGNQWDNLNVGRYSTATGYGTTASATASAAMGYNSTASGNYSTAMGLSTNASGVGATAMGSNTTASGTVSLATGYNTIASANNASAIGYFTTASGDASTAMGDNTTASESASTAMGNNTTASGSASTAMGYNTTASGDFSTAIGTYVSTNGHNGALIIGDNSTYTIMNTASDNSFRARFDGGYRFYTSADLSTNCLLSGGSNAWSTTSDVRLKENFAEINGEDFLQKIKAMPLTSWNYKKQNPQTFRHYGPMAQDFYAAFGKDKYGTVGNDTTINSADFDGVNLIAIQALEKRTAIQQQELNEKQNEIDVLKARLLKLENALSQKVH
ncbi:MAG TPA: tail fiber domain-containing protein [Ferruginibacter sp.]|nr:tail fiber domain-containing protein [Ferruginibacter sp.]